MRDLREPSARSAAHAVHAPSLPVLIDGAPLRMLHDAYCLSMYERWSTLYPTLETMSSYCLKRLDVGALGCVWRILRHAPLVPSFPDDTVASISQIKASFRFGLSFALVEAGLYRYRESSYCICKHSRPSRNVTAHSVVYLWCSSCLSCKVVVVMVFVDRPR